MKTIQFPTQDKYDQRFIVIDSIHSFGMDVTSFLQATDEPAMATVFVSTASLTFNHEMPYLDALALLDEIEAAVEGEDE